MQQVLQYLPKFYAKLHITLILVHFLQLLQLIFIFNFKTVRHTQK
jgi:hypothetical protein